MLRTLLTHPLTRGLDIDSPQTSSLRKAIIAQKPFLRKVYHEWYEALSSAIPQGAGEVLELGSGGGFLRDYIPPLITSDVLPLPGVDLVVDGHELPFPAASLRAIVMTNVLHHLFQPRRFLGEAARCVRPGGVVAMIEPWHSLWSRFVYTRLHHEPFLPSEPDWVVPVAGPLSGANGALPWILFERDRARFEAEFPQWSIVKIDRIMPFRYLVSGGVSLRSLMPFWTFGFWRWLEKRLQPWMTTWAMFALIVLVRSDWGPDPHRFNRR
jgi:SAM-dependent methyltransferase